jgi:hypothetical protein
MVPNARRMIVHLRFWPFGRRSAAVGSGQRDPDALGREEDEYEDGLQAAIAKLPWFGEGIALRASGRRRRGRALDIAEIQRVFLAWLGGPPASDVAARALVGQRTVYSVLHRVVYSEDPVPLLPLWVELGLIAGLTSPYGARMVQCDVVCLVCHAHVHHALGFGYRRDVRWFRQDRLDRGFHGGNAYAIACDIQAHLTSHFHLGEDPLQRVGTFGWLLRGLLVEDAWSKLPDRTAERVPVVPLRLTRESEHQRSLRLWRRELLETRRAVPPPTEPGRGF